MNPQKALRLTEHLGKAIDSLDLAISELVEYQTELDINEPIECYVNGRIQSRVEELRAIARELDNQVPYERGRDAE